MAESTEPASHSEARAAEWGRRQEFSLELEEIWLRDQFSGNADGPPGLSMRRTVEAQGRLQTSLARCCVVTIGDIPIEDFEVIVTIVFLGEETLAEVSKEDSVLGDVRVLDREENSLMLSFWVPLSLREWFTDPARRVQLSLALEGFSRTEGLCKRWDPGSEKPLGVRGFAITTPLPASSDEPDRSLSAPFHQAVAEFMSEVRASIRRWDAAAVGAVIAAGIVLALTHHW